MSSKNEEEKTAKMIMDPVSFLQLFCNQNNFQLDFTSISEQKTPGTMFTFRCDMENLNATGSAASKKRAKQVSARMMICKMIDKQMFEHSDDRAKDVLEADLAKEAKEEANKVQQGESGEPENNPVSKLAELCVKKHWSLPAYKDDGQIGPPHERVFRVSCFLQNLKHSTLGEGSNKKSARRTAAQNMLDYLKQENHDMVDEVLDRLPGNAHKNPETTTFIDCIKKSKNQANSFGKLIFLQKIDQIYKELASNSKIWNYIDEFTKGDLLEFCMCGCEKLTTDELETIIQNLAEIGNFEVKRTRSQDHSYIYNITLQKDNVVFFSWYGKSIDKDIASKQAFSFSIKSFIDEMRLFKDLI